MHALVRMVALLFTPLVACTGGPRTPSGPSAPSAALEVPGDGLGATVYRGEVRSLGTPDSAAIYRYERFELASGDARVSSHLTRDREGQRVLLHRAWHDAQYRLRRFVEVDGQRGHRGALEVVGDRLRFTVERGGQRRIRERRVPGTVVVGPTLFGVVLQRWDGLVEGATHRVHFAVVERARTYPFDLRLEHSDRATTTFVLISPSPIVRASVPPMRVVFDTETRHPVRFEGRVPPVDPTRRGSRPLDGRVEYTMMAESYR